MARSPVFEKLAEMRQKEEQALPRYTVAWLAQRLGVDRSAIYRWLTAAPGWQMPEKRRRQIAALLDMRIEDVRPGAPEQQESAA